MKAMFTLLGLVTIVTFIDSTIQILANSTAMPVTSPTITPSGLSNSTSPIMTPSGTSNSTSATTSCPGTDPIRCNGTSEQYCCPLGANQTTNVCCNQQNECVCQETGFCPYQGGCCKANTPIICVGTKGYPYCCDYGPRGEVDVCCTETFSCAYKDACCPRDSPLFCGVPGNYFCCPYGDNQSTQVCCENTCTTSGNCKSGNGLIGFIYRTLGALEPRAKPAKAYQPSLRFGEDNDDANTSPTYSGYSVLFGSKGDGRGKQAPYHRVGGRD